MEKAKGPKKGLPTTLVLRAQGPGPPKKPSKPATKPKTPEEGSEPSLSLSNAKPAPLMLMNNLPYMGELTFGDGRPRRGRKPKKADICHLISKNYGITFPQAYVNEPNSTVSAASEPPPEISKVRGLLRGRRRGETDRSYPPELLPLNLLMDSVVRLSSSPSPPLSADQPLNLCIRDSAEETAGLSTRPTAAHGSRIRPNPRDLPLVNFNLSSNISITRRPAATNFSGAAKRKRGITGGPAASRIGAPPKKGTDSGGPKFASAAAAAAVAASNSAQVSICKFKFTGGAKPCLQEKKMLSVDSGGNFRFYSDKPCTATSPRGAQGGRGGVSPSSGAPESPVPLPKSAKSMSMCMMPALATASTFTATTPSAAMAGENEVMRWEQEGAAASPASTTCTTPASSGSDTDSPPSPPQHGSALRKRRTRKALARERLERTFKEKGFLIQTQQLESAEGATYCKFRQLRKFTRYLFRSWKDYLPDTVKEIGQGQGQPGEAAPSIAALEHVDEPEPDLDSDSPSE